MSNIPILHVSICCENCPLAVMKKLKNQLSTYAKKQDLCMPYADICVDTLDSHKEKISQQEMLYNTVVTNQIIKTLTNATQIYTFTILLISLTLQKTEEDNPNCKSGDWILISFTPSKENTDIYNIEWLLGM